MRTTTTRCGCDLIRIGGKGDELYYSWLISDDRGLLSLPGS
jgi:hypothetical protein